MLHVYCLSCSLLESFPLLDAEVQLMSPVGLGFRGELKE